MAADAPFFSRLATVARSRLPEAWRAPLERLRFDDGGEGFDPLGMHPDAIAAGTYLTHWLYDRYFRVVSTGIEHVPTSRPAILASNHSGTIPLDGMMIYLDVLRRTEPTRVLRPILDHFVPGLPFISTFFSRAGALGGSRGNVRFALEHGDLLLIFPEGTAGIGKTIWQRYELQEWRVGHAELAIRHGVPVVPTAVIGAEEQLPQIARLGGIRLFGIPYLPIPLTPIPLPVRYHLYYGPPIELGRRFRPADADDPVAVAEAARLVRDAVAALIARGLREREGIFR
ncbi:MAG: lysophospholipid acyltransferase family protein [Nannocystaceae bacterium]